MHQFTRAVHKNWEEFQTIWVSYLGIFSLILLIHEGSHREVYQEFQPSYDIFRRSGAKG